MSKWGTRILAMLFCGCILFLSGMTFVPNLREFGYAVFRRYATYMPSGGNVFDSLSARITAFEDSLGNVFWGKEGFQQMNASMQYAIGKQMLFFGDSTMVKLKGGQLYELRQDENLSETVYDLVALNQYCESRGIPMLFVYAHTSLYGDDLLPVGAVDYNDAAADKALAILREGGVDVLDSREFLAGYPLERIIYYTDFHWTVEAALAAAREAGAWLAEQGVAVDQPLLAEDAYTRETVENVFLGRLGQRIGPKNIAPEDFTLLYPAFDTYINVAHTEGSNVETHQGPFDQAVMRREGAMAVNEEGYSVNCYGAYGPHAWESLYQNLRDGAPDSRVLVLKDSYGTPAAALLANSVGELLATDQRKSQTSAQEYVDQYQPEAVVVFYCQDMLREQNYAFMDP